MVPLPRHPAALVVLGKEDRGRILQELATAARVWVSSAVTVESGIRACALLHRLQDACVKQFRLRDACMKQFGTAASVVCSLTRASRGASSGLRGGLGIMTCGDNTPIGMSATGRSSGRPGSGDGGRAAAAVAGTPLHEWWRLIRSFRWTWLPLAEATQTDGACRGILCACMGN